MIHPESLSLNSHIEHAELLAANLRLRPGAAFVSEKQLKHYFASARADGTISLAGPQERFERAIHLSAMVRDEDVRIIGSDVLKTGYTTPDDVEIINPEVQQRIAKRIEDVLYEDVLERSAPHLLHDFIAGAVESRSQRRISQLVELSANGFPEKIVLANFDNQLLTPANLEDIRSGLEAMHNLTGGASTEFINLVAIVPPYVLGREIVGRAEASSRTILLSSHLIDKTYKGNYHYCLPVTDNNGQPWSKLKETVVHEAAHMVDIPGEHRETPVQPDGETSPRYLDFGSNVGWEHHFYEMPGKEEQNGSTTSTITGIGRVPVRSIVFGDNGFESVDTAEHFGESAQIEVPPTDYANNNSLEDFADSAVIYAYNPNLLGPLRRNTLRNAFHLSSRGHFGPSILRAEVLNGPPTQKLGPHPGESVRYSLSLKYLLFSDEF